MDIQRLFVYAENARNLLRETLAAHPETWDQPLETLAAYKSIHQLVAHMVGAEQRWTGPRLYDEPRPPRYEEQAAPTWEGGFADWDIIRARTRAFVQSADEAARGRIIQIEMPQWNKTVALTAEEVVFHALNHQAWHLGQVSMAWQQMGIDPPNFDYPFLCQSADG